MIESKGLLTPDDLDGAEDRKVGMVGHSLYVTIPSSLASDLGIEKGDSITIGRKGRQVVILPKKSNKLMSSLAEIQQIIDDNKDALDYLADK